MDELVAELRNLPKGEFKPNVFHCTASSGGALEVYLSPEEHVAKYVAPNLMVFESASDPGKIVGLRIEKLKDILGAIV